MEENEKKNLFQEMKEDIRQEIKEKIQKEIKDELKCYETFIGCKNKEELINELINNFQNYKTSKRKKEILRDLLGFLSATYLYNVIANHTATPLLVCVGTLCGIIATSYFEEKDTMLYDGKVKLLNERIKFVDSDENVKEVSESKKLVK